MPACFERILAKPRRHRLAIGHVAGGEDFLFCLRSGCFGTRKPKRLYRACAGVVRLRGHGHNALARIADGRRPDWSTPQRLQGLVMCDGSLDAHTALAAVLGGIWRPSLAALPAQAG